jgi:hypothetical protein
MGPKLPPVHAGPKLSERVVVGGSVHVPPSLGAKCLKVADPAQLCEPVQPHEQV